MQKSQNQNIVLHNTEAKMPCLMKYLEHAMQLFFRRDSVLVLGSMMTIVELCCVAAEFQQIFLPYFLNYLF